MTVDIVYQSGEAADEDLELLANQEIEDHFKRRIGEALPKIQKIWTRAKDNHRFVWGGDDSQWDRDDARNRRASQRAVLTHNDISKAINITAGREVQGRVRPNYMPRDDSDAFEVEISRRFMLSLRDRGDHEQAESEWFRNTLIENIAWIGYRQDLMRGPVGTGLMVAEPVSIWEMLWDEASREKNLLDRMWDARGYWVSFEEFAAMFPDEAEEETVKDLLSVGETFWVKDEQRASQAWPWAYAVQSGKWMDVQRREVFLVHYVWRERTYHYFANVAPPPIEGMPEAPPIYQVFSGGEGIDEETGETVMLSAKEQLELARDQYRAANGADMDYSPVPRWKYREAYFAGNKLISSSDLAINEFPRQAMTAIAYRQPGEVTYYGPVDLMKDQQIFKNAVISMMVTAMQHSAKGNIAAEEGTFKNLQAARAAYAQTGKILTVNPDKLNSFKELVSGQVSPQMMQLLEIADRAVWSGVGLNPASMGDVGGDLRRISGQVVQSVKEAAAMSLAGVFDSLRLGRKQAARLYLEFKEAFYDEEDLARIVGPKLAKNIRPKEEWQDASQFDIVIDEAESTPDQKAEAFGTFIQTGFAQAMVQAGLMPPEILPMIASSALPAEGVAIWDAHLQAMRDAPQPPMLPPEEGGAPPPQ